MKQWFSALYDNIIGSPLEPWLASLPQVLADWQANQRHGEFDKWCRLLDKLPSTTPSTIDLLDRVAIGKAADIDSYTEKQITGLLKQFMPWRKGPFFIHDIHIDTEWRSDWKWERLLPHISSLNNRRVLDVGCGSGYHLWRMLGQGTSQAIGIDPTQLFLIQFQAIKHFLPDQRIHFAPIGIEQMPNMPAFDTVFSMGVLYHRKDALTFLEQLKRLIRPGGELVLETLVVDGDVDTVMLAPERYAQMRNVWFLPSVLALISWLQRLGFVDVHCVDENTTLLSEQRATEWMTSRSLVDFLDSNDQTKTIEGHPAPKRAVIIASCPT